MVVESRTADPVLAVVNWIRRLVSKNRRRFTEDGFDLDLAYITKRVIAMGFPGEGGQGLIRNSMPEIVRFLRHRHMGYYKVYNLCQERSHWYSPSKMGGEVGMFRIEDHQVPPLRLIEDFCEDASRWLQKDPKNVIAVHCKAGKGRTGTMICCLLIYMGICKDAHEAIDLFARRRTVNNKGVTIPSQQRYIHYFDQVFKSKEDLPTSQPVDLASIQVYGMNSTMQSKIILAVWVRTPGQEKTALTLSRVTQLGGKVWGCISLTSEGSPMVNEHVDVIANDLDTRFIFKAGEEIDDLWRVEGDVKIQVFYRNASHWNSMFHAWVNTGFLPSNHKVVFQRHDLDKVKKWVPMEVSLRVQFKPIGENAQHYLPPCSPSTSLEDTSHGDEDISVGYTNAKGVCHSERPALEIGSGATEGSADEVTALVTGRHMSMPNTFSRGHPGILRSHSFMQAFTKTSWSTLNESWDKKWYNS